jgi:predicted nucleic acid-binding Zn ribbon protein
MEEEMIYLFECQECKEEQEIECRLSEKDEQFCVKCDAPPEKMKQLINTHFEKDVSWSLWNAMGD